MKRRSVLQGLVATVLAWTARRGRASSLSGAMSPTSSYGQRSSKYARTSTLVRIDMVLGKPLRYQRDVGFVVRSSLLDVLNVPKHNWFEVIREYSVDQMPFDRNYLGIHRTNDCVFIQVTLGCGHSIELKKRFYKAVVDGLRKTVKIRPGDIFISLVEVPEENWSPGSDLV
jgi:4-oxalocrotonate tautomerase